MALLPYKRYELLSAKAPWEVEAAMRAAVEPRRFLGLGAPTRPFEGTVGDRVFSVRRTITYRNSFLPQIRGKIIAAPEGSRIGISMALHPFVLIFMMIWLSGLGAACLFVLFASLRRGGSPFPALIPAAMFTFGWALVAATFTYEARKAEPLLESTLMARPHADAVQHGIAADRASPGR